MDLCEVFLKKYVELEHVTRQAFNLDNSESVSYFLRNHNKYKKYSQEIKCINEVRNLMVHQVKIKNHNVIEPHQNTIDFMQRLIDDIQQRKNVMDICVPLNRITSSSIHGNVLDYTKKMVDLGYSNIPIMQDNVVIGIYNEKALFNYLGSNNTYSISPDLSFNSLKEYLTFNNRENEIFIFVSKNYKVDKLMDMFEEKYHQGKRIALAFITEHGKKEDPILGLISIWDLINAMDDQI